ncbi:hypothetical protein HJFPF1_01692 [Paramyrothecium foliicola]|nr:hypothetical protein HJFPF1_01692 [Paramyrothecium foliicola]
MQLLGWSTIVALLVSIGVLTSWVNDPSAGIVERTVHTTLLSSLAGGTAVNAVCAGVVRAVRAVPPGDELGACTPYGLMGGGIAARLHMYWINGYTRREWAYVTDTPTRVANYAKSGVEAARGLVENELRKQGLLKSAEGNEKSEL